MIESPMTDQKTISDTVQKNCHISDSQFAGDYTLCVYLLKMREFYRWEKDLPYGSPLPSKDIGLWLTEREELWETFEEMEYIPIVLDNKEFDPFESQMINQKINPQGLVYSGGLGNQARPHFFLGDLIHSENHGDFTILVAGKEHARDLTAPPAMAQGNTIFIRRESLRRMLWEKLEEWRWNKGEGAMAKALSYYDFDNHLEKELENMTDAELNTVLLHEIGEIKASEILGESWNEMILNLPRSAAEFMARAVRDHLADCLSTLPALLDADNHRSLHFYFGNFKAMRKELFPSLLQAYEDWAENGNFHALEMCIIKGEQHWKDIAISMTQMAQDPKKGSASQLKEFAEKNKL